MTPEKIQKFCHNPPCRLAVASLLCFWLGWIVLGPLMLLAWVGVKVAMQVLS